MVAAYLRAPAEAREELERLWTLPQEAKDAAVLARARALVEEHGGRAACERRVERASRAGAQALRALPEQGGVRGVLDALITRLVRRDA